MTPWGYHLIVNAARCCPRSIRTPHNILAFGYELVEKIDMVAYGPPLLKHFGKDGKAGYTFVQLIETSNVIAHFVEDTDDAYLDIFSCKTFDQAIAEKVIRKYFSPAQMHCQLVERSAPSAMLLS